MTTAAWAALIGPVFATLGVILSAFIGRHSGRAAMRQARPASCVAALPANAPTRAPVAGPCQISQSGRTVSTAPALRLKASLTK